MAEETPTPIAAETIGLSAEIVTAYVSNNVVPAGQLGQLIRNVHDAVTSLIAPPAPAAQPLTPPVPIRKTVTPDHIISLEDGRPYKTLKRHLAGRGLSPDQYRQKWGLPPDYPMVAANYAAQRSELAKSAGLGQSRAKTGRGGRSRATSAVRTPGALREPL